MELQKLSQPLRQLGTQVGHAIVAPQTATGRAVAKPHAPRHWVMVPWAGTGAHEPAWHHC